jgi:hypothetical protein
MCRDQALGLVEAIRAIVDDVLALVADLIVPGRDYIDTA